MKLENQVCTLAQAKRLKKLGVWQDSLCWYVHHLETELVVAFGYSWTDDPGYECYPEKYSAFTVAELGAMLPKRLKASWKHEDNTGLGGTWESSCNTKLEFDYDDKNGLYIVKYPLLSSTQHKSEAVARAGMLISLLGKQLITPDEINQRLKTA